MSSRVISCTSLGALGALGAPEFFVKYRDLKDVWYLLAIEYFCRSFYCLEENVRDWRHVEILNRRTGRYRRPLLYDFFRYCVDKYGYDNYIRSHKPRANINQFLQDIAAVRNWVMHGKVWNLDIYSHYKGEYTFYLRVSALIKILLMSFLEIDNFKNRDALLDGVVYGHAVCPGWQKD